MSPSLEWMDLAKCVGHPNPDIFFPAGRGRHAHKEIAIAAAVCASCPVTTQCHQHKLRTEAAEGVWGTEPKSERNRIYNTARTA